MPDEYVVEAEIAAAMTFLARIAIDHKPLRLLEIGCGNGSLAEVIHKRFGQQFDYIGIDYTIEMIELARSRNLPFQFHHASVLALPFMDQTIDVLLSTRVLINLLEVGDQCSAFDELARVLRPGASAVLIEGFKEGLENLNRARAEFLMK